ncbi:twin-arginine translocase subunit TatC [Candidatus Woesearchaeota archaeon]|nr:twin-arginine translocase subunit TatC [Candidatus Woesearchaeota archaeon]
MKDGPIIEHLDELRSRLIPVIIIILVFFVLGTLVSGKVIDFVNDDLMNEHVKLISITPLEFMLTKIKVGLLVSVIISSPVIVYQALTFAKPALKKRERSMMRFVLPSFVLLFLIGIAFAYFIFLPVAIFFLTRFSEGLIYNLWSINRFYSFIFVTCLSAGLIFQLPLLMLVLKKLNIIDIEFLKTKRSHVYVSIFVLAALLTPPDVVTQVLIGLPLILLYELSLAVMKLF